MFSLLTLQSKGLLHRLTTSRIASCRRNILKGFLSNLMRPKLTHGGFLSVPVCVARVCVCVYVTIPISQSFTGSHVLAWLWRSICRRSGPMPMLAPVRVHVILGISVVTLCAWSPLCSRLVGYHLGSEQRSRLIQHHVLKLATLPGGSLQHVHTHKQAHTNTPPPHTHRR